MTFFEKAAHDTAPLVADILAQPFLQELAAGTLSSERFVRYMQQDALYLADYAKILTQLASKAPNSHQMGLLVGFGQGAIAVEQQLHTQLLAQFSAPAATQKGAACLAYTSYLLAQVATRPFCIGMASVLPCFTVYTDVGQRLLAIAKKPNTYQPWIDTYAAPEFAAITAQACKIADTAFDAAGQADQAAMHAAYVQATKLEAWFWADTYSPLFG
jgi:thiaminase/transcriptional activator TenA